MYIDVFFMENFVVNYFLLLAVFFVCRVKKTRYSYLKLIPAAVFGAVSAASVVFFGVWNGAAGTVYKITSVFIIVIIAFGYGDLKRFLIRVAAFYGFSFMLAGALTAVIFLAGAEGDVINGILYWRSDSDLADYILAGVVVCITAYTIYKTIRGRFYIDNKIVRLDILLAGKTYSVDALVDTGNELTEPFSGRRAIIVEAESIPVEMSEDDIRVKTRFVPYRSLGNENGAMTGIIPDGVSATIKSARNSDTKKIIDDSIVCLCGQKLSEAGNYTAIINDELLI